MSYSNAILNHRALSSKLSAPSLDALQSASNILTTNVFAQSGLALPLFVPPLLSVSASLICLCGVTYRHNPSLDLSSLDAHIHALALAQSALNAYLSSQLSLLKQHKNAIQTHISKIPYEILARILLFSIDSRTVTLAHLQSLASVSRYWLDVVRSDPRFWCRVDFQSPRSAALCLRKSKDVGLRIDCATGSKEKFTLVSAMEDFMTAVSAEGHGHRWRTLNFQGSATPRLLRLILEKPRPMLENLTIKFSWHYQQTWLFALPLEAPLKSVTLVSASLDWFDAEGRNRMKGLKDLELRELHVNPPPVEYLLQTLEASPDLESLVLIDIANPLQQQQQPGEGEGQETLIRTIPLPHLHTLQLTGVPQATVGALLACIDAPNLRKVVAERIPSSVLDSPHFTSLLRRLAENGAPRVNLSLEGRLDQLRLYTTSIGADTGIELTFDPPPPPPPASQPPTSGILTLLAQISALTSPTSLRIGKTWWWDDDADVLQFPLPVSMLLPPSVASLDLGKGIDARPVLEHLSNPAACPNLRSVTLKPWDEGADVVKRFMERRWCWGGGLTPKAAKLTRLELPARVSEALPAWLLELVVEKGKVERPGKSLEQPYHTHVSN